MKKYIAVTLVAFVLLTGVASAANDKSPFEMIWEAITDIQDQIDNIALLPGLQGEQGPVGATSTIPGPAGQQGEKGDNGTDGTNLMLKDANGQNLGIIISADRNLSDFTTYLPEQDLILNISQYRHTGVKINLDSNIYYAEVNCQGTAYIGNLGNPGSTEYTPGSNRLFRHTSESAIPSFSAASTLQSHLTECQNAQSETGDMWPLEEVLIPFSVPLAYPLNITS